MLCNTKILAGALHGLRSCRKIVLQGGLMFEVLRLIYSWFPAPLNVIVFGAVCIFGIVAVAKLIAIIIDMIPFI